MSDETKVDAESVAIKPSKASVIPNIFVNSEDKLDVEVIVFSDRATGEFLSVIVPEIVIKTEDLTAILGVTKYKFVFTKPNYDKMNQYRKSSMEYDPNVQRSVLNPLRLRDYFIIFHLKEWNVKNTDGEISPLTCNTNGSLDDKSTALVYSLHSSILDVVMTTYERKMVLI